MSRLSKLPVIVPQSVTVTLNGNSIVVKGPKGELSWEIPQDAGAKFDEGKIMVEGQSNLAGLTQRLISNMVSGVTTGWTKTLQLSGTGYRASVAGSSLNLALGFSHPVVVAAPTGITFEVKEDKIHVRGSDKAMVGEVAAKIRGLRPADPYKAKGFKYEGEIIVKKAGKAAKAGAAAGAK